MLLPVLIVLIIVSVLIFLYGNFYQKSYFVVPVPVVRVMSISSSLPLVKVKTQPYRHFMHTKEDVSQTSIDSSELVDANKFPNLGFYSNQGQSFPKGALIEEILENWSNKFQLLQNHTGYIQWLFPLMRRSRTNPYAQPLKEQERCKIMSCQVLRQRVLRSLAMMLRFYGIHFSEPYHFCPLNNFQERFDHLQRNHNNYKRITRILESLLHLGFRNEAVHMLKFLADMVRYGLLPEAEKSINKHWIPLLNVKEKHKLATLLE